MIFNKNLQFVCFAIIFTYSKYVIFHFKILTVKENDIKALYRRGTAYIQIGKLEAAESDLKEAQKLNPEGCLSICLLIDSTIILLTTQIKR